MVVEYLITIKTLNYKKIKKDKHSKYLFVKFRAPLSQKIINIQLYISCKAFIRSIDSGDHQMIYTIIISLLIEKLFYLLRPQNFSFQIGSEFIDTFVKFSNFMSQGWGF